MPDISMCQNQKCPARGKCLRYRARPCDIQAYAGFSPAQGRDRCDYFCPIDKTDIVLSMRKIEGKHHAK